MHFHVLNVILALRVSKFRFVIPKRLDYCAAPVAIAIGYDPVFVIVPVALVTNRLSDVDCDDEPENRETSSADNAKVADSNVEYPSALHK